jgi:quercetin dioxygenase-like cupin family protein
MSMDPVVTNSEHYKVLFENDRVRVLEYTDRPGDVTTPHQHPDSVMYTLSSFRRRLVSGDAGLEVELAAGAANWLPAQIHHGENIGDTATHVIFVELKGAGAELGRPAGTGPGELGPRSS